MRRYCLDTSAYGFFNRGDQAVVEIIDSADWLGLPAVTLGELETGFLLGSRRKENQADTDQRHLDRCFSILHQLDGPDL